MNRPIGVFDSGIGGLTVLEKLKEVIPEENFIYYADSQNNPYGEKNDQELWDIVNNNVIYLMKRDVKLIVIACNTATTRCIDRLRTTYPEMIFVGIEPAIKVACDQDDENILVMATPATIDAPNTRRLITNNQKQEQKITLLPCAGLANLIEENKLKEIDLYLSNIFKDIKANNYDAIVLGCTHYPLIKDRISKYFPNASIIDGSMGVAREVKRQLEAHNIRNTNGNGTTEIINSRTNI